MKIVAGMGCIDDYIKLVHAGADEVFCGYVPYEWNKKYGNLFPLNRREVLYYNVQINSLTDMKILRKMVDKYKVPVTITFNYLYYIEEQYKDIEKIMKDLIKIGFDEFIIADIGLILYIREKNIKCKIQLSGEAAEMNDQSIDFFNQFNISRYIFHRKNTIEDMKYCITNNRVKNLQYEAFILNERCHYTGAFCSSLHCDEMAHLCKIQYRMGKINEFSNDFPSVDEKMEHYYEEDIYESNCSNDNCSECEEDDDYILGATGCGICSLKKLKNAGVTHLKVVGRGNFIDVMGKDVKNLKKAINMLDIIDDNETYENKIKNQFFNGKCSGECYYL